MSSGSVNVGEFVRNIFNSCSGCHSGSGRPISTSDGIESADLANTLVPTKYVKAYLSAPFKVQQFINVVNSGNYKVNWPRASGFSNDGSYVASVAATVERLGPEQQRLDVNSGIFSVEYDHNRRQLWVRRGDGGRDPVPASLMNNSARNRLTVTIPSRMVRPVFDARGGSSRFATVSN